MRDTPTFYLPGLSTTPGAPSVGAQAKIAMHGVDAFLRHAEGVLIGRTVLVTRGDFTGRRYRIDSISIAAGASGMHMFVHNDDCSAPFEIGVTVELTEEPYE